jgi:hypothetical protein
MRCTFRFPSTKAIFFLNSLTFLHIVIKLAQIVFIGDISEVLNKIFKGTVSRDWDELHVV